MGNAFYEFVSEKQKMQNLTIEIEVANHFPLSYSRRVNNVNPAVVKKSIRRLDTV